MPLLEEFKNTLTHSLLKGMNDLNTPREIQDYLDDLQYIAEERNRSPVNVMKDRQAHCLDGGILAALALHRLGYPALIIDLVPQPNTDDDHVLALFRIDGFWGAVAKSNYAGLRFREAVFRNLRELAMSYFEKFFNASKEKTLRAYTRPLDLASCQPYAWLNDEEALKKVISRFYNYKPIPLISRKSAALLTPVDERSYMAGTYGTDPDWIYGAH